MLPGTHPYIDFRRQEPPQEKATWQDQLEATLDLIATLKELTINQARQLARDVLAKKPNA